MNFYDSDKQFNYEIIEFAFDVMESTNDVDSAVNILLYKVGRYFDLSRIIIRESSDFSEKYIISYQWCDDFFEPAKNNPKKLSPNEIKQFLCNNNSNNIFVYSEYPNFEMGLEFKDYIDYDVKSVLQFMFKEDDNFGVISFQDHFNRVWANDEIRVLKIISKIISAYLLKMRVFKEAEETVERLTSYDTVTGAMKYDKFKDEFQKILDEDPFGEYAVIYSDISNFKYINERYGYKQGDKILRDFVEKIDRKKCNIIVISRFFSDNFVFAIKFDNNITKDNVGFLIDKYDKFFSSFQEKIFSDVKIKIASGIYILADRTQNTNREFIDKIVDNANIARKYAKSILSEKAILFDSKMEMKVKRQVEILTSMEKALINNEFVIVLQPKVDLKGNNSIVGAEALVRWVKEDGKVIQPMEFVPLFEKNGFVVNVDFCVYEQVCKFLSQRIKEGKRVVPVSVNVSRVHLEKSDFINRIETLVQKYNVPRNLLEFELTENVFLQNSDRAIQIMNTLKSMNFKVSMDDFGSGYSSLNLLKKLPVDILKMDKGFLDNDEIKGNDEVVIKSIIDMAKKMKIAVLCEGVETEKQAKFLIEAGCDLAQGYYFSKPVKIDEFNNML